VVQDRFNVVWQDTKFCHVGRGAASDSMQSPLRIPMRWSSFAFAAPKSMKPRVPNRWSVLFRRGSADKIAWACVDKGKVNSRPFFTLDGGKVICFLARSISGQDSLPISFRLAPVSNNSLTICEKPSPVVTIASWISPKLKPPRGRRGPRCFSGLSRASASARYA